MQDDRITKFSGIEMIRFWLNSYIDGECRSFRMFILNSIGMVIKDLAPCAPSVEFGLFGRVEQFSYVLYKNLFIRFGVLIIFNYVTATRRD